MIDLYKSMKSLSEIKAMTGIPKSTIFSIVKKYKDTGIVCDLPGRGRKRKTSAADDRTIISLVKKNRHLTAPEVANEVKTQLHVSKKALKWSYISYIFLYYWLSYI